MNLHPLIPSVSPHPPQVERAQHDLAEQERKLEAERLAAGAAGIDAAASEMAAQDRDADGRRLREAPGPAPAAAGEPASAPPAAETGTQLDLSG